MGIGLSAACGFRVFTPLLITSLAAMSGYINLGADFMWLSTMPALIALSIATSIEVLAYFIPFIDNLLDHAAGPAAMIAGTILTASFGQDLDPFLKWTLAAVAGGGSAALVHSATSLTRLASSATTFGAGNFVVAIVELIGAVITSLLSIFAPILAVILILALSLIAVMKFRKLKTN